MCACVRVCVFVMWTCARVYPNVNANDFYLFQTDSYSFISVHFDVARKILISIHFDDDDGDYDSSMKKDRSHKI